MGKYKYVAVSLIFLGCSYTCYFLLFVNNLFLNDPVIVFDPHNKQIGDALSNIIFVESNADMYYHYNGIKNVRGVSSMVVGSYGGDKHNLLNAKESVTFDLIKYKDIDKATSDFVPSFDYLHFNGIQLAEVVPSFPQNKSEQSRLVCYDTLKDQILCLLGAQYDEYLVFVRLRMSPKTYNIFFDSILPQIMEAFDTIMPS